MLGEASGLANMGRRKPDAFKTMEKLPIDISETSDACTDITGQKCQRTEVEMIFRVPMKQSSWPRVAVNSYSTYSTKMFRGCFSIS